MKKSSQKPKQTYDIHRTLPNRPRSQKTTPADNDLTTPDGLRKSKWKRLFWWSLAGLFGLLIIVSVWDAISLTRAASQLFGSGNVFQLLGTDSAKSQNGRTNILLVGYSIDDPGHPGATLTDSLILLSIDRQKHSGYMLSIPRDLYVKIPGFGYGKINEAYQDGGIGLLRSIVETNFGQPINYYALVNYSAVRDTVNALGGIAIDIKSPDPRGLYDPNISLVDGGPLKISNGPQTISGQTALNLTRARGDAYGSYGFPQADFDRTQHQRQVLVAIKQKLNWKLVLNPLKNGQLFQAAGKNVKTDVKLGEARSLFGAFNSVPTDQLRSISLRELDGQNLLASFYTEDGLSALVPSTGPNDYTEIQAAVAKLNQ